MAREHFADRLWAAAEAKRSQVVVGLDPDLALMPPEIVAAAARSHGRTPAGAAEAIAQFNEAVLDAVAGLAVAVKPQIAFYERFGCEGLGAYARTIRAARERGLIVIADVKRSDIGSTAAAYADAHLPGAGSGDWAPAEDFHADAVTVNPLLGSEGVAPFWRRAADSGCGVFVLVKTSNPSSKELQDVSCEGRPLYERLAALVEEWGAAHRGRSGYGLVGAVVGATFPEELAKLRSLMPHAPLLVPGYGAQGAGVADVRGAFDAQGLGAVVNSSRGVIYAFRREPYSESHGLKDWQGAIRAAADDMRREIWEATHGREKGKGAKRG